MSHLDAGVLHELLDGEIPSTDLRPIQAHLAACAECRARLNEERQLLTDVNGLIDVLKVPASDMIPVIRPGSQPRRTHWLRDLAWAATVVIAAGLGYAAHKAPMLEVRHDTVPPLDAPANVAKVPTSPQTSSGNAAKPAAKARDQPIVASSPATPPPQGNAGAAAERRIEARQQKATTDTTSPRMVVAAAPKEALRTIAAVPPAAGTGSALDATARADARRGNIAQAARVSGGGRGGGRARVELIDTISFVDAIARLGGSIRLIDGRVPLRIESQGNRIRIVYGSMQGEVVLQQQLVDGQLVVQLLAPPGFPADSATQLRARVRN